jgi:uncharacterized protein DUF2846
MRLKLWALIVLPLFFLSACARTSPFVDELGVPILDPQLDPEPTKATLCIYRPFRFGSGLASPHVTIDGKSAVLLHSAGYTRVYLSPGKHSVATVFSEQWVKGKLNAIDLEVQSGQTYYLQVLAETRTKYVVIGYATNFTLALMPDEIARPELRELHYLEPTELGK